MDPRVQDNGAKITGNVILKHFEMFFAKNKANLKTHGSSAN